MYIYISCIMPFYVLYRNMYMPGAFLLSSELVELAGTLQCLDAIDFKSVLFVK